MADLIGHTNPVVANVYLERISETSARRTDLKKEAGIDREAGGAEGREQNVVAQPATSQCSAVAWNTPNRLVVA